MKSRACIPLEENGLFGLSTADSLAGAGLICYGPPKTLSGCHRGTLILTSSPQKRVGHHSLKYCCPWRRWPTSETNNYSSMHRRGSQLSQTSAVNTFLHLGLPSVHYQTSFIEGMSYALHFYLLSEESSWTYQALGSHAWASTKATKIFHRVSPDNKLESWRHLLYWNRCVPYSLQNHIDSR